MFVIVDVCGWLVRWVRRVRVHVDVHVQMGGHGLSGNIYRPFTAIVQSYCMECNVLCAFLAS